MKYTLLTFTVLALSLPFSLPVIAQENDTSALQAPSYDIRVEVNGLVCDFCAQAITKTFLKRDEVASVNVDLSNKIVEIDLEENATLPDQVIHQLITDAGYDVTGITHAE